MFSNHADFSGISETQLKIDQVIQKAFIVVNEEGSEAAVATGILLNFFKNLILHSIHYLQKKI